MPNITSLFKNFNDSIKVSESTLAIVYSRFDRIKKSLDNYYYSSEQRSTSLYVGSIGRQTDIHTSDVDIIYKLPLSEYSRYNGYLSNGQQKMLQDFRAVILQIYPNTYIKADGLVAVVAFADGITFEIMPAFINSDSSFTYPISSGIGSWGITNPTPEISAMNQLQKDTAGNARKLARMARSWKEYNSVSMGGLLIDTYVYKFLSDYSYKDKSYTYYDWITRDFFKFLSEQDNKASYIYALGSSQRVYITGNFVLAAKRAYQSALAAITAFDGAYYHTAASHWKDIYGTKFKLVE